MESFEWNDNFITGIGDVDQQHQVLVGLINHFGNLLAQNEVNFDDIESIITELICYAQYHFEDEEASMIEIGIDKRHVDFHIKLHREFLNEVTALHVTITEENLYPAKHLLDLLTHWLAYHILGVDQNMARQVDGIKAGLSAADAFDTEERERDKATEPLLAALNTLFLQVSERNKELIKLNESLEEKVAIRTRELSEANRHLEELSLTDTLTKLPNRRHAMRYLTALWEESTESAQPMVCMMIDADHFKAVNDTHGHDAGDQVLIELSKTLQHSFRSDDTVCRLGGDEFFVACPNTDEAGGVHIAELAHKIVSDLRVPTGDSCWVGSISIGVAARTPDMSDCEDLLRAADKAVYVAKRDGKNCVRTGE